MSGKSFFLRGKKNTQPTKSSSTQAFSRKFYGKPKNFSNEEIDSDEELEEKLDMEESDVSSKKKRHYAEDDESGSDIDETAQQKRLRLAESYLRERAVAIEEENDEEDDEIDDEELTGELTRRLELDILDRQGRIIQRIAESITILRTKSRQNDELQSVICESQDCPSGLRCLSFRGHRRTVTSIALSATGKFVFSGSKDGSVSKWNVLTGKRERLVCRRSAHSQRIAAATRTVDSQNRSRQIGNVEPDKKSIDGHKHAVMSIAVSCDDKFVASGDARGTILVWTFTELQCLRALTGHRGAITALAFRKIPFNAVLSKSTSDRSTSAVSSSLQKLNEAAHTLFSASADRTVKQWDTDQLAYVDTMLGHEDAITGLDSLFAERCVTSGGRDSTVRVFKPALESQLVFHGDGAGIECVASLSDRFFVSGSDRNSLSLWNVMRKKPIQTIINAHQVTSLSNSADVTTFDAGHTAHDLWISAIAAVPNGDIFATGSRDGYIRIWQCKVDTDVTEDGEKPVRHRITLAATARRQQSEHLRGVRNTPLLLLPVRGVINSIAMRVMPATSGSADVDELVVAVGAGREHKAGRWWNLREAQNVIKVFRIALEKRSRSGNLQPV